MIKRFVDLTASAILLLVFSPVILLTWCLVRVRLGSPAFFRQARPGKAGLTFRLYKFRTMKEAFRTDGTPLADEERMTPTGSWIRRLSLDELPQLLNVLKGEMSLVGPRPLLICYLDRYNHEHARRHQVRPGITGWAQVNGRNAISWQQKLDLDVWYVDHQSFWLDCRILYLTVVKVLRRDGISAEGSATAREFLGYDASGQARQAQDSPEPDPHSPTRC
jgi:lipopolysaccharide/colanic/teichoic acid biosynthesis glycosyltransferase